MAPSSTSTGNTCRGSCVALFCNSARTQHDQVQAHLCELLHGAAGTALLTASRNSRQRLQELGADDDLKRTVTSNCSLCTQLLVTSPMHICQGGSLQREKQAYLWPEECAAGQLTLSVPSTHRTGLFLGHHSSTCNRLFLSDACGINLLSI